MNLFTILKKTKKEFAFKLITGIVIRSLLLIIPYYWSNLINLVTEEKYSVVTKLIIIILILSLLYYVWCYLNQKAWYNFYNKIYLELTNSVMNANIKNISLGEYTNIINNDIDIIGTFLGNGVTRLVQIVEFLIIYIYFLNVNFYIFLITVIVSILMAYVIFYLGSKIQKENKYRKENLDIKTMNIHNIYDVIKSNKKIKDNSFIASTKAYLKSNAKFNVFANAIIYLSLFIIELVRYLIIIYAIYLVSQGKMSLGTVLLIYTYYAKIIANFEVLGTISAEYQSVKVSIKRLNNLKKEI